MLTLLPPAANAAIPGAPAVALDADPAAATRLPHLTPLSRRTIYCNALPPPPLADATTARHAHSPPPPAVAADSFCVVQALASARLRLTGARAPELERARARVSPACAPARPRASACAPAPANVRALTCASALAHTLARLRASAALPARALVDPRSRIARPRPRTRAPVCSLHACPRPRALARPSALESICEA